MALSASSEHRCGAVIPDLVLVPVAVPYRGLRGGRQHTRLCRAELGTLSSPPPFGAAAEPGAAPAARRQEETERLRACSAW